MDFCRTSYFDHSCKPATKQLSYFINLINNVIEFQVNFVILIITVATIVKGRKHGGAESNVKKWELAK